MLVKRLNDFHVDDSTTPTLSQSAAIDEDSTDLSYFCEVQFGSEPGETVYLLMDTGSSALWVMGEGCTSKACKSHSTFGSSNSKSLSQGSDTFNVSYNTGDIAGPIVTDNVSLAGINVKMEFGLALQTTDNFDSYPMDGILGLAREPGSGFTPPTFMQILQQNKVLKSNLFGLNLQRASDNSNDGEINFGDIDTSKFQGDLNYLDTTGKDAFWEVPVDGFQVDGKASSLGSRSAIIDSGTSFMFLPPSDAASLFQQVPGFKQSSDDSYTIPCDTEISISMVFNKIAYDISPKDYVGPPTSNGQCTSNIFSQVAVDEHTWLLGDTFMKNVYTVFDLDQNRIGFGVKSNSSSASNSAPSSTSSSSATSTIVSSSDGSATSSPSARPTGLGPPSLPTQSGSSASGSSGSTTSPTISSTAVAQSGTSTAAPRLSMSFNMILIIFVLMATNIT